MWSTRSRTLTHCCQTWHRTKDGYGESPEQALADGAYESGSNIHGMESREIEFLSNVSRQSPRTIRSIATIPHSPFPSECGLICLCHLRRNAWTVRALSIVRMKTVTTAQ